MEPHMAERSAHQAGVIARQLRHLFHQPSGPSAQRFWLRLRLARIDELLRRTRLAVAGVAAPCGFAKAARFPLSCKPEAARPQRTDAVRAGGG